MEEYLLTCLSPLPFYVCFLYTPGLPAWGDATHNKLDPSSHINDLSKKLSYRPTLNLIGAFFSVEVLFPNNFSLCQVDIKTSQYSEYEQELSAMFLISASLSLVLFIIYKGKASDRTCSSLGYLCHHCKIFFFLPTSYELVVQLKSVNLSSF